MKLPAEGELIGVARVEASAKTALRVSVAGKPVARIDVLDGPWVEVTFAIPPDARGERTAIEVSADGPRFASFHYWFGTP